MQFVVLKTLLLLSLPLPALLLVVVLGFVVMKRSNRIGKSLIASSVSLLYLLSLGPVANALIRPLEARFKPLVENSFSDIDYVAVLGSGVIDLSRLDVEAAPSATSLQRLVHGISLYRKLPASRLVLSGGSGDPERPELVEAEAMKRAAISLGVPPEDIVVEGRSRTTLENVDLLKSRFEGKRILLVTSAFHMGRAIAMFKKSGIDVFPAPTAYMSEDVGFSFFSLIPGAGSLGKSTSAFYEYFSRSWYSLKGVI